MAKPVTGTTRPTEPHFHLPEPPRGGQDPGPGQDLRLLPCHGATSKIQHGNQSAGNCSCAEPLPTTGGAAREAPICTYPVVDAPYVVQCSFPKKQVMEVRVFLPLLWRWGTCQPQLSARGHSGGLQSQAGPWLNPQGSPGTGGRADPCGQGARQLLSPAGSCPRGGFPCRETLAL